MDSTVVGRERVRIPAGDFEECYKVVSKDTTGRVLTSWYASQVGLVGRINEASGIEEVLVQFIK
jgi:hypothetical protein